MQPPGFSRYRILCVFLQHQYFRPRLAGLRIARLSPEPEYSNQCGTGPRIRQRTVEGREYYLKDSMKEEIATSIRPLEENLFP
jgi:hypothetical protein